MNNILSCSAAGLLFLAWLAPNHYPPWFAFHGELLAGLSLLLLAGREVWLHGVAQTRVPLLCASTLAIAAVPLAQFVNGTIFFAGDAWLATLYLLGFALAQWTGYRLAGRHGAAALAEPLALVFVMTGLVCVCLQLYQWLSLNGLGVLAVDLPPNGQPFANLAQPNQLASLLFLGVVGALLLYERATLNTPVVVLTLGFLMLGLAMTGSRTAWVEMSGLVVWMIAMRRRAELRTSALGTAGLGFGFAAMVLCWAPFSRALLLEAGRSFEDQARSGLRPLIWRTLLDAVGRQPWFGYGWNQTSVAQSRVALDHAATGHIFDHSHNLVIDLLLWNGVPLGLALIGLLAWWWWQHGRECKDSVTALLMAGVGGVFVHALLEYPLDYAYFLLPVGLMMGIIDATLPIRAIVTLPRRLITACAVAAACLLVWVTVEYAKVESNVRLLRFETARIGTASIESEAPDLTLLTQWSEYLRFARMEPTPGLALQELAWMQRLSERYPFASAISRYATAEALNGRPQEATDALGRLCKLHPKKSCKEMLDSWRQAAVDKPSLQEVTLPIP